MSDTSQSQNEFSFVGWLATSSGVLSAVLFYTGWIYRWFYFGFFQIEATSLNLPLQSFLFVPIQVLLGDPSAFLRASLTSILLWWVIRATLWFFLTPTERKAGNFASTTASQSNQQIATQSRQSVPPIPRWIRSQVKSIPPNLIRGLITVLWLLAALFWLARYQGISDAQRDTFNKTSTLPVVTFIAPQDSIAIGSSLDDIFTEPPTEGFRFIGDIGLFDIVQKLDGTTTDISQSEEPIVWRLLADYNGYLYMFKALTAKERNERPIVVSVRGEQLLILSPSVSTFP